jgi:hypothetical protein
MKKISSTVMVLGKYEGRYTHPTLSEADMSSKQCNLSVKTVSPTWVFPIKRRDVCP